MPTISRYQSPLGEMTLVADANALVGLWFEGQRYAPCLCANDAPRQGTPILTQAKTWLGLYFSGREPSFTIPVRPSGSDFQRAVWRLLAEIPYGRTITYSELARRSARVRGVGRMSAQAVGSAVGRNPIALLIPCHRVIGASGNLIGYAAGIEKKAALLQLEESTLMERSTLRR